MTDNSWNVKPTTFAQLTINPLRTYYEQQQPKANPEKSTIILQAGDPTIFNNFQPHKVIRKSLEDSLRITKFSYAPSAGLDSARKAVADYTNRNNGDTIAANDVYLTSGCSMAVEIAIRVLASPGDNVLNPRPTYHYSTWLEGSGINVKNYNLIPSKDWEADLDHMESMIDSKTRAILVNSPGNPCGNVFSKKHILDILAIAERHHLPIISDEIYEHFVFPGVEYHSFSSLSKNVPVLSCSGLTKRFLIPAIRMGWLILHDRNNILQHLRQCFNDVSTRNFEPNIIAQEALPDMLSLTPQSFYDETVEKIWNHAKIVHDYLKIVPGLNPILPKGAMYLMIGIDLTKFPKIPSCMEFTRQLAMEQSVFTFPGYPGFCFPGFMRIVLTPPEDVLIEACERIAEFCGKHYNA